MTRILFVCLGNICRSPLAEGIMRHLANKFELTLDIDSAGTSGYHIAEAPDPRTIKNALKNGIDLRELRARQFLKSDFEQFDIIYVMDRNNLRHVKSLCKKETHLRKIQLLPHPEEAGNTIEIPDPYYGSEKDFELVFELLHKTCEKLCTEFKNS